MSDPLPRILAIGDIHGCSEALNALLVAAAPTPEDLIITLGDYVDRGIDSAGVIDRLLRLSETHRLIPLRGNHEEMMMDARRGAEYLELWRRCGGDGALISYAPAEDAPGLDVVSAEHWAFLDRTCLDIYETPTHFFVHGGVDADLPLDGQTPSVMRWANFPPERPHVSGKIMVCGHTPQKSGIPAALPHAICIDTGIGHGGWLTCLEVNTGFLLWQANERGHVRESVLPAPKRRW